MATYKEIQKYVKDKYQINIDTCWIADIKEKHGIKTRIAPNRLSNTNKVKPCPPKMESFIEEAFIFFGMISHG